MISPSIADMRKVYQLETLNESSVKNDPLLQFADWWQQAIASNIEEPNAMILSTASATGTPSSRVVLLKGIEEDGFVFYTNYESRKAREITVNPQVSLLFFWKELERQVRIEGKIVRTSNAVSDAYFASRPAESRIGAWCSPQSQVIASRTLLDENVEKYTARFNDGQVPRPRFWGGYIVTPHRVEFWQGRPSRLHDRIQYRQSNDAWKIERLAP